ncbi:DNA glycosylase [Panus rudis PR-1116 ss-1]|nr:DNA glycosylase [Panus rudis PR-1116 ss-1]
MLVCQRLNLNHDHIGGHNSPMSSPRKGKKRSRTDSLENNSDTAQSSSAEMNKAKKLKLLASHALVSPFPKHPHPTSAQCYDVYNLLMKTHPDIHATRREPRDSNNSARTCGSVPNVLESLIGTILSQNTSGKNSTAAKRNLDLIFGRNNFQAIAEAQKSEVVEAIRSGGLANKKAEVIQRVLRETKQRHGIYSLQHLAGVAEENTDAKRKDREERKPVSNEEAMKELVSFEGVGPKTASCVLLFCLGRTSFPVDTHVFRLSRLLNWVPAKADRVTAQAHLDLTIPNELKFGLHVLMVGHGRRCKGCKSANSVKGECVLKEYMKNHRGVKEEDIEKSIADVEIEAKYEIDSDVETKPVVQ